MLPDLSRPAFGFAALCTVRFGERKDGATRKVRSDYRCQLRYGGSDPDIDVRVYLVGQESASSGQDLPIILAFLDWDEQQERCRPGTQFELREGSTVTGTGTIHFLTSRGNEH